MAHRHVTCGPLGSALANESTKAGSQRVHRSIHKNNYTSRYSFSSIIMIILLAAAAAIYFSSLVVFLFHCRIFCCFSSPPPFHHVPLPIVVCSFCRPAMCVSDTRHYGVCLFFFHVVLKTSAKRSACHNSRLFQHHTRLVIRQKKKWFHARYDAVCHFQPFSMHAIFSFLFLL